MAARSVAIVVPTLGMIDVEVVSRLFYLERPLNGVVTPCWPVGMDTATARNASVQTVKDAGCSHVLFLDHDVIIPKETITLLASMDVPVACGLYYTKTKPPEPLTIVKNRPATNWTHGDLVTVDVTGLGCALIDLSVFDKIDQPWFQSGNNEEGTRYTEDAYFFNKLEKVGIKPIVNTGLCCGHKDLKTGEHFYWDEKTGLPTWDDNDGPHTAQPASERNVIDLTKGSEPSEEAGAVPATDTDAGPTG